MLMGEVRASRHASVSKYWRQKENSSSFPKEKKASHQRAQVRLISGIPTAILTQEVEPSPWKKSAVDPGAWRKTAATREGRTANSGTKRKEGSFAP